MNANRVQLEINKLNQAKKKIGEAEKLVSESIDSLSNKISNGDIPHIETRGRKINEENRNEIYNLLAEGKTVTEVAKMTNKSKSYISQMKSKFKED
jgi:DNA invertase Pin-like site-specific DNA recombinase|tara:strand:+ start:1782 stop:2069 length:288 start_codon:yes stop_codon:yes gene_type:complete